MRTQQDTVGGTETETGPRRGPRGPASLHTRFAARSATPPLAAKGGETTGRRVTRLGARLAIALLAAVPLAACGSGNGGGSATGGVAENGGRPATEGETGTPALRLPPAGRAWVIFGTDTVLAEVAGTPAARERGLMDRDAVPDGTGMLFIFPRSEERSFWMRNTFVPLDIAFFDDSNRIAGIKRMEALDETLTDSEIATALVLEVRQGWFAEKEIGIGATAQVVVGPGLEVR